MRPSEDPDSFTVFTANVIDSANAWIMMLNISAIPCCLIIISKVRSFAVFWMPWESGNGKWGKKQMTEALGVPRCGAEYQPFGLNQNRGHGLHHSHHPHSLQSSHASGFRPSQGRFNTGPFKKALDFLSSFSVNHYIKARSSLGSVSNSLHVLRTGWTCSECRPLFSLLEFVSKSLECKPFRAFQWAHSHAPPLSLKNELVSKVHRKTSDICMPVISPFETSREQVLIEQKTTRSQEHLFCRRPTNWLVMSPH